eukprot:TRINITY_DN3867_c0_g2_i5.p2 TRINITY_DN3867_c0_g2~~TRINITY_DN3867_c0_g2_i5.p2  ORF type:complete len:164 (+),score=38.65 TRINITY_DN3867_c0_g2_i5:831-1322(+)
MSSNEKNFLKALQNESLILHYSGHGEPGYLVCRCPFYSLPIHFPISPHPSLPVEENNGMATNFTIDELKAKWDATRLMAKNSEKHVRLVFVSACYSAKVGDAFAELEGIEHVISAGDEPINDDVARDFATAFYRYLFGGDTVRNSFDRAYTNTKNNFQDRTLL